MQKRYYEFYAKVILEELFNINLEVMDKPDLNYRNKNKFDKIYLLLLHTVYVIEIEKK